MNNIQKTVNCQVNKMTLSVVAVIFSLVLVSWSSVNAQLFEQLSGTKSSEVLLAEASNRMDRLSAKTMGQPSENAGIVTEASGLEEFFRTAESTTAQEAGAEVEKYATRQILLQENKAVREAAMINDDFLNSANILTANEANAEVEKYAVKQIAKQKSKAKK